MGKKRLFYLPGKERPEEWFLSEAQTKLESGISSGLDRLVEDWGLVDGDELSEYIGEAKKAEKHKEFFELAQQVGLGEDRVRDDLVRCVLNFCPKEVSAILDPIEGFLNGDRN